MREPDSPTHPDILPVAGNETFLQNKNSSRRYRHAGGSRSLLLLMPLPIQRVRLATFDCDILHPERRVDVDFRPRSGRLRCISAVLASVNADADNAAVTLVGAGADAGIGRSCLVFHSSLLSTIDSTDLDLALVWLQS